MKNRIGGLIVALALLLTQAAPARACGFFCHIGNVFECGKWTSNCNPNQTTTQNPYSSTSSALTVTPQPQPKPTQQSPANPSAGTATSPLPPVVYTPVAPLAPTPVAPLASGGSGDSTSMVRSAPGGGAPASTQGSGPIAKAAGGGDASPSGFNSQNTADAPVVTHSMASLNNLTDLDKSKLGNASLAFNEAGARPQLPGGPQVASADLSHAGVKASLETNIYKTVGAIPGVEGARSFQELQAQLFQNLNNKLAMKDWDGVADAASAILKADPSNIVAYVRRAEAFNHLGRYAEAEKDALEAVKRDPSNEKAWKELAWAQLRQGKFKEALETISRAIGLNPRDAEAYAMRAYIREALGDMKGRLDDIAMAAALDSRFQDAYERAKAGYSIYDPKEEEDVLLALAKPKRRTGGGLGGLLAGLLGFLAVGAGGFYGLKKFLKPAAKTAEPPSGPIVKAAEPQQAAAKKLTTGDIVGKYQLGRIVGRGGMGQVFDAVDLSLGRPVAFKKMTEQLAKLGPQARDLFLKEARTVAQLHHPAIVEIYEILEDGDDLFMVFELLKGKTAQQLLVESGKLPLPKVVELLKPVADALDFAHGRALVHRDLKPGNIMLTEDGHVKLMDFGIARSVGVEAPTPAAVAAGALTQGFARTSIVAGTVEYRAPEAEQGIICKEGDVYSLGVTAYELLTGRLPYSPLASAEDKASQRFARASALAPGLPPGIDEVLGKALQASPERRMKTPGELLTALASLA